MIRLKRLMVPTDFSDGAVLARSYACELAKQFGAELHLFHVIEPIALPGYMGPIPVVLDQTEERAQKELEQWRDPAFGGLKSVHHHVVTGTPFVEIVRYARENEIDLIVTGTHGRSALAQVMLGSVAEKVVRKAPCAVLTVRPEGQQFVMP